MKGGDIVVLGTSAGGIEALEERSSFLKKISMESSQKKQFRTQKTLNERARKLEHQTETIRKIARKIDAS